MQILLWRNIIGVIFYHAERGTTPIAVATGCILG